MIYDEWGLPMMETRLDMNYSGLDNINNYTGYTYDEVLEVYYAQVRFYDPEARRFVQEDPVKDGGNWYSYPVRKGVKALVLENYYSKKFYIDSARRGMISFTRQLKDSKAHSSA